MSLILRDAAAAPDVFRWNGAVGLQALRDWLAEKGWPVPADLLEFWQVTGGGEIFESELLLPPVASPGARYGVGAVTAWYRHHGLGKDLVVFHQGFGLTAVNVVTGTYVYFDSDVETLRITAEYVSMNHWYAETVRSEYGDRYGLPPLTPFDRQEFA